MILITQAGIITLEHLLAPSESAAGRDCWDGLVPDDDLDDDQRAELGECVTARLGVDGALWWPIGELGRQP